MNRHKMVSLAIVIAFPFFSGCWSGGSIPEDKVAYKHKCVRWVYQPGKQIGCWGVLPSVVKNNILDVQSGDNCLFITEGQTGGQCSAATQASLKFTHAVSIESGCPIIARGKPKEVKCNLGDNDYKDTPYPYTDGKSELYLIMPTKLKILQLKDPDPEVTYTPPVGVVEQAFKLPGDILIIALSEYVVCIDLKALVTASP